MGAFDLQFTFGNVAFAIQSRVELFRTGEVIGAWEAGLMPDSTFLQIFNNPIDSIAVLDERRLGITLRDGLELHLLDNFDQYESMQIYIDGLEGVWIV